MQTLVHPFHLAIPVNDLATCRSFYTEILGCEEGRSDEHWVDLNLYGHQLVIHYSPDHPRALNTNAVDDHNVPVPHFGVVLSMEEWNSLADRLRTAGTRFIIEPYIRFEGEPGEQATMFFLDPSGNAIEFKAFTDIGQLFAT